MRALGSRAFALAVSSFIAALAVLGSVPVVSQARAAGIEGVVQSGSTGLAGYKVSLYASFVGKGPSWKLVGSDVSDDAGRFAIAYSLPPGLAKKDPVLFVEAARGSVLLTSAIGIGSSAPSTIVVNERTTVATANAFARFVDGSTIGSDNNVYGMINGVPMAANLADPVTGETGIVLASSPNGTETSTLATFNSLANVVAACVASASHCATLFDAAAPPGGSRPKNVVEALANIAINPSYPDYPSNASDPIFLLSQANATYQPALAQRPTNWLLFLRITGSFSSEQNSDNLMNGPGNFAIDEQGFVWANDNAEPRPPNEFACAGLRLLKFYPWGEPVPDAPYGGGGLSGAGYGITLDPKGNVWVSNFGFQDPPCALDPDKAAPHNSVSAFRPDGTPFSPDDGGFTEGNVLWPQSIVSDRKGNIWVANCGNDSVTKIPNGDHTKAFNIPLGPVPPDKDPQIKPFGAVVDLDGNLWTANNRSSTVSVISPAGKLLETLPGTFEGRTVLSHPVGNAADLEGNVWVANSDWLDSPCPTRMQLGTAENPSITMFDMRTRKPSPGSPYTGGGLTLPWGIAVDGDDTVWVFNFGATKVAIDGSPPPFPTAISRFCGVRTNNCPPGMRVGDPISPDTGYQSDALARITGAQIDPSGNIWITSNWKLAANPFLNPFGNSIVIAIGAAAPLKTPLIGPPVTFRR